MQYVSKGNFEIIDFDEMRLLVPKEQSEGGFLISETSEFLLEYLENPQDINSLIHYLITHYNIDKERAG